MVLQFAYRTGNKDELYDGGLSALENAFTELLYDERTVSIKRFLEDWDKWEKIRDGKAEFPEHDVGVAK